MSTVFDTLRRMDHTLTYGQLYSLKVPDEIKTLIICNHGSLRSWTIAFDLSQIYHHPTLRLEGGLYKISQRSKPEQEIFFGIIRQRFSNLYGVLVPEESNLFKLQLAQIPGIRLFHTHTQALDTIPKLLK